LASPPARLSACSGGPQPCLRAMAGFPTSLAPFAGPRARLALLLAAAAAAGAEAHGRLAVPLARNGGDNGVVAGGPGAVHVFDASGAQAEYTHGICGNAAREPQSFNRVGDVQATYVAGGTAELKVVITAHHVGYFEFELCADAGNLSESCFAAHRLLREGCECSCPGDATHSCPACESCRRWWKPVLEGELSQVVTEGYEGPILPGQGNLVPYEFTVRYVVPEGMKTSRAVLRWHYMTTNSCTSKASAPEEFWNCADVAVSDAAGDVGPELPFDNSVLEGLEVENLVPAMRSGELPGVFSTCPEDASGGLLGVGSAAEYEGLCGVEADGAYELCVDLSSGSGSIADCTDPPASGILCESECSVAWFQCHEGVAFTQYVAPGTRCKGNDFVLEAECDDHVPAMTRGPAPAPTTPTGAPTAARTDAPTVAPIVAPTDAPTAPPAPAPTPAPAPNSTPAPSGACGDCVGCRWSSGGCYTDVDAAYCGAWPGNTWCGGASVAQRAALRGGRP